MIERAEQERDALDEAMAAAQTDPPPQNPSPDDPNPG